MENTNTPIQKIGFLRRLVAFLIDSLIFLPFGMFIDTSRGWGFVLFTLIWTLYVVWMTGAYGATIGKMVLKMKIIKVDGSVLSYSDALLREIATYLSAVVLFLGYFNIIWDPNKQAWHDKIAKTYVVSTREG